jgi:aminodeoxyfutalosine deaminase
MAKIELHVHLEGTVRAATLAEIARRNGYTVPATGAFRDLRHFADLWNLTTACLRTPDDFRRIVVDYAAEAARHGAVYVEAIVTPEQSLVDDVGMDRVLGGYCDGAAEAEETHGVIVRLTPEQCRGCDPAFGEALAKAAVAHRDRGVVGFGLSGVESHYPDGPHLRAMSIAADGGLGLVPHAGEAAGPASVRSALWMGAARVRHGIRAVEDPDLLVELAERGTVLDVCPTSNVRLGYATFEDHPLRTLVAAGVACSVSTDDPALFDTDLSTEYAHAAAMGLSAEAAYRAGFNGALCDAATKERLPAPR